MMRVQKEAMAVVEKARAVYGSHPAALNLGMGRATCAPQKAATSTAATLSAMLMEANWQTLLTSRYTRLTFKLPGSRRF